MLLIPALGRQGADNRSGEIIQGIFPLAVLADLEVAVVAGAPAGTAHLGDVLALVDLVAHADQEAAVVAVVGDVARRAWAEPSRGGSITTIWCFLRRFGALLSIGKVWERWLWC